MTDQDIPFIDNDISQLPSDIRADLAERAKGDLYVMAKGVLGYQDLTEACHGPLCIYLDHNPKRFKLTLMPRGHFKTSVATISRVMQKVCRNPNERILLANETATNAERFLSAIKQHAEMNTVFRVLFSDLIPKDTRKVRWSASEVEFNRTWRGPEPTIDTMGMTGAMTSRHFTHLTFDDVISEDAAKTDSIMQDTIGRISKWPSLMVDPDRDTMDITGTRWAFYDVYAYIQKALGGDLATYIRGALDPEGQPIFPERFSLDTLAKIRQSDNMGEYMFSCLYLNNPRNAELQDFNIDHVRWWRYGEQEDSIVLYDPNGEVKEVVPISELDITVTVDLAVSEKITNDRNAIVTCGATPSGDIVVLDVMARRCTPLEVIDYLFILNDRFRTFHNAPRCFGIEGVAYQKAFKYFLGAEAARRNTYLNIKEIKALGRKEIRIRGLQPVAATGHLYMLPTQHLLRNEMAQFPLGEHDDCVDALAMQLQVWRGVVSPSRWTRYRESERQLLSNLDGYRLRHERPPVNRSSNPRDIPSPDDLGLDDSLQESLNKFQGVIIG